MPTDWLEMCMHVTQRTLEDSNSSWEVVDATGGAERGSDDGGGRDEIVCERVVQVALVRHVVRGCVLLGIVAERLAAAIEVDL